MCHVWRKKKYVTQFWLEDFMDGESSGNLSINGWIILKDKKAKLSLSLTK
jgi:hypothetical protein